MALDDSIVSEIKSWVEKGSEEDKFMLRRLNEVYQQGRSDGVEAFFDMTLRDFVALIRREN